MKYFYKISMLFVLLAHLAAQSATDQSSLVKKIDALETKVNTLKDKYESTPLTVMAQKVEDVNEKRLESNNNMYSQLIEMLEQAEELLSQAKTDIEKEKGESLVKYLKQYSNFFDLQIKSIEEANKQLAIIRQQEAEMPLEEDAPVACAAKK